MIIYMWFPKNVQKIKDMNLNLSLYMYVCKEESTIGLGDAAQFCLFLEDNRRRDLWKPSRLCRLVLIANGIGWYSLYYSECVEPTGGSGLVTPRPQTHWDGSFVRTRSSSGRGLSDFFGGRLLFLWEPVLLSCHRGYFLKILEVSEVIRRVHEGQLQEAGSKMDALEVFYKPSPNWKFKLGFSMTLLIKQQLILLGPWDVLILSFFYYKSNIRTWNCTV